MVHHVYPGRSGSSLLAGKLNGNRSYMVEITKQMGSFHIIDGEKVSVRYRGQTKSCARCHQPETQCPGKGVARDCSSDRVLLSAHMEAHWKSIGYTPDTNTGEDVDEPDVTVGIGSRRLAKEGPDITMRYNSVIINGFLPGTDLADIQNVLLTQGLPSEISVSELIRMEKAGKVTIEKLDPESCLEIMEKMHGKIFLNRKVFITSVVAASPKKTAPIMSGTAGTVDQISSPAATTSDASSSASPLKKTPATPSDNGSPTQIHESIFDHIRFLILLLQKVIHFRPQRLQ